MAYWLLKTEPSTFSFADLKRDRRSVWDGVSNNLALKHMRSVRRGDRAFIYHTGEEKAIVGIARVVSDCYPDPKAGDARLVVFDLVPDRPLERPVTLAQLKQDKAFVEFPLVRMPRLSVMPMPETLWRRITKLGGVAGAD